MTANFRAIEHPLLVVKPAVKVQCRQWPIPVRLTKNSNILGEVDPEPGIFVGDDNPSEIISINVAYHVAAVDVVAAQVEHWPLSADIEGLSCPTHHVSSCHVMSCHVVSCLVMSCNVLSSHVSCHVMSCHVMSCHVMSFHVMSCHVLSCMFIDVHWVSYDLYQVMSPHVISCHFMSCHFMSLSFHVISCHVVA